MKCKWKLAGTCVMDCGAQLKLYLKEDTIDVAIEIYDSSGFTRSWKSLRNTPWIEGLEDDDLQAEENHLVIYVSDIEELAKVLRGAANLIEKGLTKGVSL